MPTPKHEVVSLSEFGRRVGCTSKTIERYIQAGKIGAPALTTSPGGKTKIYFELGKPQYEKAQANVQVRFAVAGNSGGEYAERITPKPAKTPKLNELKSKMLDNMLALAGLSPFDVREKLEAYAAGEYPLPAGPALDILLAEHGMQRATISKKQPGPDKVIPAERRPQPHGGNLKSGKDQVDADVTGVSSMSEDELNELDPTKLTKRQLVLGVLAKQIEVGKAAGTLVNKDEVRNALVNFATEIRNRFEAIPSRCIDSMLNAAPNRAAAMAVLTKEINSALAALSEAGTIQLTARDGK